ncbi:phosphotransferase [Mesorhizobium captivum]|uniref:phosphotransferase n=1 Tax=Mesorhizobium captivum TaxID=3072319 RepID=UPI003D31C61A
MEELPPIRRRRALCHGDLHGENVRVRGGQAILIDFAAVDHGPLVIDPAALETALVLKRLPNNQLNGWDSQQNCMPSRICAHSPNCVPPRHLSTRSGTVCARSEGLGSPNR